MADITFQCAHCGKQLVVDEQGIGLEVPCPECGTLLRIPADAPRVPEEPAATPPEPAPAMMDASRDEQRTAQMLDLLREVVGETDQVAEGLHALAPSSDAAQPQPPAATALRGRDAVELLSDGLGRVREKLAAMTAEIESAGGRIQELTRIGNTLQSRISEGEAHKRRLQEEISIITKTSSQRIVLGEDARPPEAPPVLSPAAPPPASELPPSIWRSGSFLLFLGLQLALIGGVAAYFLTRNLPEVRVVSPLAADASPAAAAELGELGRTLAFGPAKALFGAPDEETADSALLGEAPRANSARKYLVFPVTLTNTSATQPLSLRYLWADAELVLPDGRTVRPVRLASGAATEAASQNMEPGAAITEQLVFPLPDGPRDKLTLKVLPGIWSRQGDKEWVCIGRRVSFRLPAAKPRAAP